MKRSRFAVKGMIVAVFFLGSWICWAAPVLPERPRLPGEVRSLAGLRQFKVSVETALTGSKPIRIDTGALREKVEAILEERGYGAVDDDQAAAMRVTLVMADNERHPNMLGFTIHVAVEQAVVIRRLDQTIRVPTYAAAAVGFATRQDVRAEIERVLENIVHFFVGQADAANQQ